jgi:hypothetical protein
MSINTDVFEHERRRLTALAYRMLGRWSEAEDTVQDSFLRWQAADQDAIESAPGSQRSWSGFAWTEFESKRHPAKSTWALGCPNPS